MPAILVIDDSVIARRVILDTLETTGLFNEYYEACNGHDGLALLRHHAVDLVLCDLEMPGMDGFAFLDLLSALDELREIPVIMLTGHESQSEKIRGLERGASDYVTKPFHPGELVARIKVQLKIKHLQDSLRESNRQLERLSHTDPLTGLANRRSFIDTLLREFERSQRGNLPLALIMVDADHFKQINDHYGHLLGDQVLIALAEALQHFMRPYDTAARFGGEEFAVILPATDLDQALLVAGRLRERVAARLFTGALEGLQVTVSLGVAALPHPRILTPEQLLHAADTALYQAKHNGRDRVEAFPLLPSS